MLYGPVSCDHSPMTFSVRVDLGPHGGMVSIGCAGGLQMLSL